MPLPPVIVFFFNDTATTEIYTPSLHDALPISYSWSPGGAITASITVSPTSTTTYTVTVTDALTHCANSGTGTVTINTSPAHTSKLQTPYHVVSPLLPATTSSSSPAYSWSPGGP